MRPIIDIDSVYRYVICIQFDLTSEMESANPGNPGGESQLTLNQRLVQLDKLLRCIPSKLPYNSTRKIKEMTSKFCV